MAAFSFSLTNEVYTSIRTCFCRSLIAISESTAISTEVAGWSSGSKIPARTYSVSAETRNALDNCCSTSAEGLRSSSLDLAQVGVGYASLLSKLTQRQLSHSALSGNELTERAQLLTNFLAANLSPCQPLCLQLQANASCELAPSVSRPIGPT